ncbi:hypothetical protein [Staphylococcus gallinarum]|nr:hypothetical protein [Staphylococcus gallinarum]
MNNIQGLINSVVELFTQSPLISGGITAIIVFCLFYIVAEDYLK